MRTERASDAFKGPFYFPLVIGDIIIDLVQWSTDKRVRTFYNSLPPETQYLAVNGAILQRSED